MLINLLKLLPPESAHHLTIKLLKLNLTISEKKTEEFNSLKQTILGIDFANPLGFGEQRKFLHPPKPIRNYPIRN